MPHMPPDNSEESEREVNDGLSEWEREAQQAQIQAPAKRLVFRDKHNFPIGFVLHKTLNKDEKRTLTKDIEKHGGIVLEGARGADTLLIPTRSGPDLRSALQVAYSGHGDPSQSKIHVEFAPFVRLCIKTGVFRHRVLQIKAMGGIPAGYHRSEFTAGDDEMLCWFLSRLIPEKGAGGRLGLKVYQKLLDCAEVMPEEYAWATRHTAESWKQRYKMHQAEFDVRIEELVAEEPPRDDQKWPEDRRMTKAAIKKRQRQYDSDNSWEGREQSEKSDAERHEQDESEAEIVKVRVSQQQRKSANKKQRVSQHSEREERSQKTPRISKGKAKAIEIENVEQAELQQSDPNSLFDGDINHFDFEDLPPSIDLRSPDRTLVAFSRPNLPNALASQATLVANSPRNDALMSVSRVRDQPGSSIRAPQPSNQSVWVSVPPGPNLARPLQSSPHRPAISFSQPPPPSSPQQPPTTSQLPKRAARRRPPAAAPIVEPSAPYRNTRQRSQTVEPPPQPVQKPKKKQKQKTPIPEESDAEVEIVQPVKPVRASARLRSIDPEGAPLQAPRKTARKRKADIIPEAHEEHEHINENDPPIGETLAEEMDVANLLTQDTFEQSAAPDRRGASMDTDDAHIDHHLRAGSLSSRVGPPAADFNILDRLPSDMLKRFESSSSRRHSVLPTSSNRPIPSHPRVSQHSSRKPRQSAPSRPPNNDTGGFKGPNPRTPLRQEHDRGSSIEPYPLSGTRARELVEVLTQREKGTPFRPLPGTRAAKFADAV